MTDILKGQMKAINAANCKINGLYRRWSQKHSLNYYMAGMLYTLITEDAVTQKELCEYYEIPKQTVNNIISSMKKDGIITLTKRDQDKRKRLITLTEFGMKYAEEQLLELFEIEAATMRKLGADKIMSMVALINEFSNTLENEMSSTEQCAT